MQIESKANSWLRTSLGLLIVALCLGSTVAAFDPPDKNASPEKKATKDPAKSKSLPPPKTALESATTKAATTKTGFIRIRQSAEKEPISLDTSIVRYGLTHAKHSVTVDLVGVVHIGDAKYYKSLNKKLAGYDAVLYELVAPKGTRIPKGGHRSNHPVSFLQRSMKQVLELEFQLEEIDYTPKTFVHADMTPTEFSKSMEERNESFFKIMMRSMRESMKQQLDPENQQNMPSDWDLIRALMSRDRSMKMKRLMAGQLAEMERHMKILEGPNGSTLITERNKRALEVMQSEIEKGKKKLAIFYGSGHMPDMEKRLNESYKAKRQTTEWLTAWDMSTEAKNTKKPADKLQ